MSRQLCDKPLCENQAVTFVREASLFFCAVHAPADAAVTS